MKKINITLRLVSEWPLGPPHYPVKKVVCAICGQDVWLEINPEYLLLSSNVEAVFECTNCALKKTVGGS
jgi:hypothetical protein